jgi:hypothetical protein
MPYAKRVAYGDPPKYRTQVLCVRYGTAAYDGKINAKKQQSNRTTYANRTMRTEHSYTRTVRTLYPRRGADAYGVAFGTEEL